MELKKITKHCYYLTPDESKARPALGYILCPRGEGIMIDAGNSKAHMNDFLNVIAPYCLPLPGICLITHSHWDHMLGMQYFATKLEDRLQLPLKRNTPIDFYLSYNGLLDGMSNYKLYQKALCVAGSSSPFNTLTECRLTNEDRANIKMMQKEYGNNFDSIRDTLPNCGLPFMDIGNAFNYEMDIDFLEVPTPHCKNHSIVFVADDKVIYGGDCLLSNPNLETSIISDREDIVVKYVKLRNILSKLDFEYFVSSPKGLLTRDEVFSFLKEIIDYNTRLYSVSFHDHMANYFI